MLKAQIKNEKNAGESLLLIVGGSEIFVCPNGVETLNKKIKDCNRNVISRTSCTAVNRKHIRLDSHNNSASVWLVFNDMSSHEGHFVRPAVRWNRRKSTRAVKDGQRDTIHTLYVTLLQCNTVHSKTLLQLQNYNDRLSNRMLYACSNITLTPPFTNI